MNEKIFLTFIAFVLLSVGGLGQKPSPAPVSQDDAVRITTDLVQVDVVVVDKDGRQITDLKQQDFELKQDGKVQKISRFSYLQLSGPQPAGGDSAVSTITSSPAKAPGTGAQGRLITFIVDDGNCSASRLGMVAAREALERFVEKQMQANDRVAIFFTRAGNSVLQQYTTNKELLLKAAEGIRWRPLVGGCSSDGGYFERARPNTIVQVGAGEDGRPTLTSKSIENEQSRQSREAAEAFNRDNQVVGSLGVVDYVIRGLASVPGRKVVFFLSDGISLRSRGSGANPATDQGNISTVAMAAMRDLTDRANRASVVLNTVSARGTFDPGSPDAADEFDITQEIDTTRPTGTAISTKQREGLTRDLEEGMFYLANETGGNFYRGANNLEVPIAKALDLEKGYYLLAYEPDDETFKGKAFHKIEVNIKRPGVKVMSRSGFLAKPDVDVAPKLKSADSELYQAIAAPLPKAGLDLQLTAFFGSSPADGNFIRSFVLVQGSNISFADEPGGLKKITFDVVAVTLNEKSKTVDEFNRTHTIKVDPGTASVIASNGVVYAVDVPVKTPGTFNFRVAMRDVPSGNVGSAGQAITVPDLAKVQMVMSGLSVSELSGDGKFARPSLTKPDNGFSLNASKGGPVTRQFRRSSSAAFSYTLYNAPASAADLTVQVNLFRDGKLVIEGKPQKLESQTVTAGRVDDHGFLRLDDSVEVGQYTLEIVVRDEARKRLVSSNVDFEVIE